MTKSCNKKLSWMWIGYIAAVCTPIALYAEVIKLFKIKSAREISWYFIGFGAAVAMGWILFGAKNKIWPSVISSSLTLIAGLIILIQKLMYDSKDKIEEEEKEKLKKIKS